MRALLLFAFAALAWSEQLRFAPRLSKGQTFDVLITRVLETGQTQMPYDAPSGRVAVTVLEAGPEGYVLGWAPDAAPLDPTILGNETAALAAAGLAALHFEPVLDREGRLLRLRNESEVLAQFEKFVRAMTEAKGAQFDDPEMRRKMNDSLAPAVTPEALLALSAMDLDIFFFAGGKSFDSERNTRATLEVPNPLGSGGNVRAERTWTLLPAPDGAVSRTVAWSQRIDPQALRQLMRQMIPVTGVPEESIGKLPSLEIEDEGELTLNPVTGIPVAVRHTRSQKMGTQMLMLLTTEMRVVTK